MRHAQQTPHVACTEFMRNACKIFVGRHRGRDYLEDINLDEKIILKGS
jgi:hypothetical protein